MTFCPGQGDRVWPGSQGPRVVVGDDPNRHCPEQAGSSQGHVDKKQVGVKPGSTEPCGGLCSPGRNSFF